ncbi:hypothetical protein J4E91_008904 [Alternaria rosae]|nr:hypothetical protein J4E91_008904 [Alternaria rosae]
MPLPAYSLHLEANFDTAQRVWNAIKSLAALALANQRRHHKIEDSAANFTETTFNNHEVDFSGHQERRFVTSVRQILSGDPTVVLPCPIGTLEEFEEETHRIGNELKDQPTDAWKRYAKSVVEGYLDTEDYDFTALEELYYDPLLE